ncbi:MAG: Gfo/Idh/MocA family oxidoreductase [Planctomycetota bacterium]
MRTRRLGIVMNGVTGRMGQNQHLLRSVVAMARQGGVACGQELVVPEPILVGRDLDKLRRLARRAAEEGLAREPDCTTDLEAAIRDPAADIVFDASTTSLRARAVELAAAAGKPVYCEKPTAGTLAGALGLATTCERAGIKNGVVQDKLFLPGVRKLRTLLDQGFFGRVLSARAEFGYWVFTGEHSDQPAQRPSWNYRKEDGGGIVVDMFCHWRYVIDHLFGGVAKVFAVARTELSERRDENGDAYPCTADDAAYAVFTTSAGLALQFNSSWTTRVRRDDLLTLQVDGTHGSAVAGLRDCWVQPLGATPKPVWNPDLPQSIDFLAGWQRVPDTTAYDNAFKVQWEMFLRHVVADAPWSFTLRQGALGVQLAELGLRSSREGRMLEVPPLA